jgi:hypothetical protein
VDVADVRQTFYNANSLSNLFTNVAGDTILQFLNEIDLYTPLQAEEALGPISIPRGSRGVDPF